MHPKNPLLQKCLAYLESLPNIRAVIIQVEPYIDSQVLADGRLRINTSNKFVDYVCEIKTGLTNNVIEQVAEYFTKLGERLKNGQRPLLVTSNLSNLVVEQLLEKNIEFVDINGNIYLNSPELYVVVRDRAPKDNINKSLEITNATLLVMYALLKHPQLSSISNNSHEKIASISNVTTKTVKNTLKKLQDLDYIRAIREGYKITNYVNFLERWELGYSEKLRAKLLIGTFEPIEKRDFSEVATKLQKYADKYGYLIGGELAAAIITKYLRPISATLHLNQDVNYRHIAVKLKLKPDPKGSIAIIQNFSCDDAMKGQFSEVNNNLVNPILIHAELVRTGNSRLKETAELIYDRYIEKIAHKND